MTWLSNESIDQLGNSLIKDYMGNNVANAAIDIEGFVTDYLKLPLIYRSFADSETVKLGFISDGVTSLPVVSNSVIKRELYPKGTIVIERCLRNKCEIGRRRFTVAHEAAHYIMDKSLAAASFHREFDSERQYSINELKSVFNIKETNVDRLAGALLMPEFLVKRYLNQNNREYAIDVYDNGFIRPEDHHFLQKMAADMGTSITALKIRIKHLGLYMRKPMNDYLSELGLGKETICDH